MAFHLYDDQEDGGGLYVYPKRRPRVRSGLLDFGPEMRPGETPGATPRAGFPNAPVQGQPGPFMPLPGPGQSQEQSILGMSPNRFATLAGLTARAIAPNSIGGRLGASAAG